MGRMVLWFPLEGPDAQLTEEELFVEMSTWELRVSVGADSQQVRGKPTGRKIDALSGELWADIRRRLSWWDMWVRRGVSPGTPPPNFGPIPPRPMLGDSDRGWPDLGKSLSAFPEFAQPCSGTLT